MTQATESALAAAVAAARAQGLRCDEPVVYGKQLKPRYVLWGEGTTDEMCLGLLQVADR